MGPVTDTEEELVRFKRRAEELEDVITLTRKYMKENDVDTEPIADYVRAGGYCPRCCARMDNHSSECDYFATAGADEKKAQSDCAPGAPGATEEPAPVPTVAESVDRETAPVLAAIAAVPSEPTEPVAMCAGAEYGEVDASKARVREVDASEVDDSEVEVTGKGKSVQLAFASAAAARAWLAENVH
jgi:hypothetical protein